MNERISEVDSLLYYRNRGCIARLYYYCSSDDILDGIFNL